MKRILFFLALLFTLSASAQTYNPINGTLSNKPYAPAQAVPTDMRSFYYDSAIFTFRAYQDTIEVLSYLNLPKWRGGNYLIYVHSGGVLNANGTYTGGTIAPWWFKDGVADVNLVPFSVSGGGSGTTYTASNGDTLIGNDIQEGGTLNHNTLVRANNYTWRMDSLKLFTLLANGFNRSSFSFDTGNILIMGKGVNPASASLQLLPNNTLTYGGSRLGIARIVGTDGVVAQVIEVNGAAISFNKSGAAQAAKVMLKYTDSLDVASPTRIAVWHNDTLKSASVSSVGDGIRDTAKLVQGPFIYINNADSTYQPNKPDVQIAVDTGGLRQYFNQFYNTYQMDTSQVDFIVYEIAGTPNYSLPNGTKVLVANSGTTGAFVGHENEIATLVGGVYTYQAASGGDQLLVSTTQAAYQFNAILWNQISYAWLGGGNLLGIPLSGGTRDAQNVLLKTKNTTALTIDTLQNVALNKFIGTRTGNYAFIDSATGNIDTGFFRPLIAGPNITITAGPIGDTIASTPGGGGADLKAYAPLIIANDTIMQRFNVLHYGAVGDSTTDDCAAIRAAVAAAFAAGGGTVYFPAGHYRLGCALIHSQDGEDPNAQIVLPLNDGATNNFQSINFEGEAPQNMSGEPFAALAKNRLGTIIESSILDTGWVFGSSSYDNINFGGDVNWTWWSFKDLQIRTRTRTAGSEVIGKMGAINSDAPRSIRTDGIMIATQSSPNVQLEPDSTIGIKLPHWNNNSRIELNRTTIQGYYTGLWAGEHLTAHDLIIVNVHNAIYCPWAIQSSYIDRLAAEAYVNAIYVSDEFYTSAGTGLELYISEMNVEHNNTPATWNTYATDVFYEDSSVQTKTKIGYYHAVETGLGRTTVFNTNAPTKVTYSLDGNEYFSGNVSSRGLGVSGVASISAAPTDGLGPIRVTNTGTATGFGNIAAFYGNRGQAGGPDDNTNIAIFQKNSTAGNYANIVFAESNNQPVAYLGAKIITHSATVPVSDFNLSLLNAGSRNEVQYWQADGDVGIGNTNPQYKLHVTGNIFSSTNVISPKLTAYENSTGYTDVVHVNSGGSSSYPRSYFLGYGSGVANYALYVASGNATGGTQIPSFLGISTNANPTQASAKQMMLYQTATVSQITNVTCEGCGTLAQAMDFGLGGTFAGTPNLTIKTTGVVQINGLGAGDVQSDASGNLSVVSDERVKRNIKSYRSGLRELMKINPISYQYNGLSGNEINGTYAGFSAQNVGANIPNSTGVTADGYLTLQDRAILATLVNAVKEQQQEIEELKAEIKRMKHN